MKAGNQILFVICFIVISAGAIFYFEASAFQKKARIAEGTVIDSNSSYYFVKYTSDDGVERSYKGSQGKNKKKSEGNKMKVFYQIDNPDKARVFDGVKFGRKAIIFGIFLLFVNIVSIYQDRKRITTSEKFKTTGRKTEAEILKIEKDMNTTVLKKNPYMIDIRWVDQFTGREYNHTIRYVWEDPHTLLAGRNTIDVYIDREKPDDYFLDIEFLGPAAK